MTQTRTVTAHQVEKVFPPLTRSISLPIVTFRSSCVVVLWSRPPQADGQDGPGQGWPVVTAHPEPENQPDRGCSTLRISLILAMMQHTNALAP